MAIYVLNMKTFGRTHGSSAPGASAYRAGERIHDERTGRTYDHSARRDVLYKEILVPAKFGDAPPEWTRERSDLWNMAEAAESRRNARVAREIMVALPAELSDDRRVALVRGFAQELTERHGFALDLAVHSPRLGADRDPRNFHAHLLVTTREVTRECLGPKTALELGDGARLARGLEPFFNEFLWTRERWATATNQALREAQIDARVDHRSLAAQGIDREPALVIPRGMLELERRGERCDAAERLRAEHQARVLARLERAAPAERTAMVERAKFAERTAMAERAKFAESAAPVERAAAAGPVPRQSLEDIRREARESWWKARQQALASAVSAESRPQSTPSLASRSPAAGPAPVHASAATGRSLGDDYGL